MRKIIILISLLVLVLTAQAIQVGGHITHDTTWSPINNPYEITSFLYVDRGATLRILPGTVIKINSASGFEPNNFIFVTTEPPAKSIWVKGTIIAEGTSADSIYISRNINQPLYQWGTIFLDNAENISSFKHCRIENAGGVWNPVYLPTPFIHAGAVSNENSSFWIDNCTFVNNSTAFAGETDFDVSVTNSYFNYDETEADDRLFFSICGYGGSKGFSHYLAQLPKALVAGNDFNRTGSNGIGGIGGANNHFVAAFNTFTESGEGNNWSYFMSIGDLTGQNFIYSNQFFNTHHAIEIPFMEWGGESYIKSNTIHGPDSGYDNDGILAGSSVSIDRNTLVHSQISSTASGSTISNNSVTDGKIVGTGQVDIYNNVVTGYAGWGYVIDQNTRSFTHNLSYDNELSIALGNYNKSLDNNIFWDNQGNSGIASPATYKNNILKDAVPEGCIDGGGNQYSDPRLIFTADSLFYDANSPCIDAAIGDSSRIDMYQKMSPFDGNGDGNAQPDIGPVEYGSQPIGKLMGQIFINTNHEPLSYALIYVTDNPALFTVADNEGSYLLNLSEDSYNITVRRPFYQDATFSISIENGETMLHDITMLSTTGIDEPVPPVVLNGYLKAYPNPFTSSIKLDLTLPKRSMVSMAIYNIRGQKVKTLQHESKQESNFRLEWDGKDDYGSKVSTGIYFCHYSIDGQQFSQKILRLK